MLLKMWLFATTFVEEVSGCKRQLFKMKKAILVLGMHRTGTSAVAGFIHALGACVGKNLMIPTRDNEKGYYENLDVYNLNQYILEKSGSSWDDIDTLELKDNFQTIIKYVIEVVFREEPVILIKDPRICLLLPLYIEALTSLSYEIHYVRAVRNIDATVKSLVKRDGFSEAKCKVLIKKHSDSLNRSLTNRFLTIAFSDLLINTDEVVLQLQKEMPFLNYAGLARAKEFLDKSLKHH